MLRFFVRKATLKGKETFKSRQFKELRFQIRDNYKILSLLLLPCLATIIKGLKFLLFCTI